MAYNDRLHAVEAETVRLYFRNYSSNILTAVAPLVCTIRPRGSATVISTPTVVNESTGVYYVDWSVPSSQVDSLRYSASFPGPGDYQDIWTTGATTLISQDFFVAEEGFPSSLARIVEPLKLQHVLETPRFEIGARDFLTWRITDANGRLLDGTSLYPEGEIQIFYGDQLIRNYEAFTHKEDSSQYKYFLDTTSLESGVYKVQSRFFVPADIVETAATVTGTKSLSNGYSNATDSLLGLTIDDSIRTISFPTSATQATVDGNVAAFDFSDVANDVFIVDVDGTEKTVRLVNTGAVKAIANVVLELNGTVIAPFTAAPTYSAAAGAIIYPIVTSYVTLGAVPAGINGTTLDFTVDGVEYNVQFTSVAALTDIVDQVNTEYGYASANPLSIMRNFGGVLTLGNTTGALGEIVVIGGTSLPYIGFIEGQSDDSTHSISPAVASNNAGALRITGTSAGTLEILSGAAGSIANPYLKYASAGVTDTGTSATGAIITGAGATYPISVTTPAAGQAISSSVVDAVFSYPSTLNGDRVDVEIDGITSYTVTFADNLSPAAITSTFAFGHFSVQGLTLSVQVTAPGAVGPVVVTYAGTDPISLNSIITQTNTQLAAGGIANVVADAWNGHLRLRGTATGVTFQIKSASTGDTILGLDANLLTNPEDYFQNDQVVTDGAAGLQAGDYVEPMTQADIVEQMNAVINVGGGSKATASFSNDLLYIVSNTTGAASSVEVKVATTATDLNLVVGTYSGTSASNYQFQITTAGPVNQTVSFTDGIKSLNQVITEINGQASGIVASAGGAGLDQLILTTAATGAAATITVTDITAGIINNLFGAASPIGPNLGVAATSAVLDATAYSAVSFLAGGYATLVVESDLVASTTIDISGIAGIGALVAAINAATVVVIASNPAGNTLRLQSATYGENSTIVVGGINDGSNANPVLGFAIDGAETFGTNGQPYTLAQIVDRVNAAFGGNEVASTSNNALRLDSVDAGAGATIVVMDTTSADIVDAWGLAKGTYVGDSQTQISQTIVSPKLVMFIGD